MDVNPYIEDVIEYYFTQEPDFLGGERIVATKNLYNQDGLLDVPAGTQGTIIVEWKDFWFGYEVNSFIMGVHFDGGATWWGHEILATLKSIEPQHSGRTIVNGIRSIYTNKSE